MLILHLELKSKVAPKPLCNVNSLDRQGSQLHPSLTTVMPTPRNLFVLGFSIFFALVLPKWMEAQPHSPISTGSSSLDSILTVILSSSMFIALVLGFTLDNTIPGQPTVP